MCWPWNHKFKEVDRQFYEVYEIMYYGYEILTGRRTRLTYQCEKCQKFKQIKVKGYIKK
jgi:hypothetical protein